MEPHSLPESIITRFRTFSLERIARIESAWSSMIVGGDDEEAARAISRDLHTLKGDAKIVGYDEAHLLAHKLEELLDLAAQQEYRVSEDFELVVTMALQFLGMVVRKKGALGIDLQGFLRQVDEVARETRVLRRGRASHPRLHVAPSESPDRLSERTRLRLATVATEVFLEYLSARNPTSRIRLRSIWQTLRETLVEIDAVAIAPLLHRHAAGCRELATLLGKRVDLEIDVGDLRLESRVAEAVDQAILHIVRNAIDHGIEKPAVRIAAGKPEAGRIRVRLREAHNVAEIVVDDDGVGIDVEAVRARGTENALIDRARAASASETELVDLIFVPGFSTRHEATEVSGRGVGMDVVKSAITKVGGAVKLHNRPERGVVVTLSVPSPIRHLRVYQFLAPGGAINFAVSARWTPTTTSGPIDNAIDPVQAISLLGGSRQTMTKWTTEQVRDRVMTLRWGFLEIALRVSTEPQIVTADRICATPDDAPVEVVLIDGVEALLLRPEHVTSLIARSP